MNVSIRILNASSASSNCIKKMKINRKIEQKQIITNKLDKINYK